MASESGVHVTSFGHQHYVPCVRWKLGEYQAILRLTSETKKRITPLIEVPKVGWDFETGTYAKTVNQHLAPLAERVEQKWGHRACFVDLNRLDPAARMSDGSHPADYVFAELRKRGCAAIPVTGSDRDMDYQKAIRRAVRQDCRGICLRLSLEQAVAGNVQESADRLLDQLGLDPLNADLVLDLDAPASFVPVDGFVKLLLTVVGRLPHRNKWRTFTVIGTSFPKTMGALQFGPQLIDRYEWIVYKRLTTSLSNAHLRVPTFGDYGISHPEVLRLDMRKVKPAASIRYTADDAWYVLKGKNVRDHGYKQYRRLSADLTSSPHFAGRGRSRGDAYIDDCANAIVSTGNLTTWRWVGTNHHIEKVVRDVANWFAS